MSDEGEKDKGTDAERPARPEPAGSRRARRDAARAEGEQSGTAGAAKGKSVKGKSAGSAPMGRTDGTTPPSGTKRDKTEEKLPLPKRIARYIREVVAELRKVIWPTRKQMVTYTIVVLVFVAFMVGLVALLDWIFGQAMFALFG